MLSDLNYPAVIVAALAAFAVGFVYYLPPVMGAQWMNAVKLYAHLTDEDMQPGNMPVILGSWLLGALVNAFVLALLIEAMGTEKLIDGIAAGLVVWAGFGLTFSSWPVIFAKQQPRLWLINNGAFLLMQVVMAVILTQWR